MNHTPTNGKAPGEIDSLLRGYFQREMPKTWSPPPAGEVVSQAMASGTWLQASHRLLVGVSLVAMLLLYVALAPFFPHDHRDGRGLLNPHDPVIGHRPGVTPKTPTPIKVAPMP